MAPTVEKLVSNLNLGSSPFWDHEAQVLYFVDITGHRIHKYDPKTKQHTSAQVGHNVSVIIPVRGHDNEFIVGLDRELVLVHWDGVSEQVSKTVMLKELEHDKPKNMLNDGKCDASGRLWIGTRGEAVTEEEHMQDNHGSLYSIQSLINKAANSVKIHMTEVGYSSGFAFNQDAKKMYHYDAKQKTVNEYDYDEQHRELTNKKVVFTASKHNMDHVVFDGMTVDAQGHLYIAIWDSKVIKIDPHHPETLMETIEMPEKKVTAVTFGGEHLDELYVTTGHGLTFDLPHGGVYRVTGLNVKGHADTKIIL